MKRLWGQFSFNNKGFFMPTVMAYLIIMLMFILLQVNNVLSLMILNDATKQSIYLEAGLNEAKYQLSIQREENNCKRIEREKFYDQTYQTYQIQMYKQCHVIPYALDDLKLTNYYENLEGEINELDANVTSDQLNDIKKKLDVIDSIELIGGTIDTINEIKRVIITGGESLVIDIGINQLQEYTYEQWVVYEINLNTNTSMLNILIFELDNNINQVIYSYD